MSDRVVSVDAWSARIDLPDMLRLGPMEVRAREYAAVRVRTGDGLVGRAYCLTRDAPVSACVERLIAPHVVGHDAGDPEATWRRAFRATIAVGRVGLVIRALGLVDIALWDITAQRAGVPLWRLLGAEEARVPAMMVAAYPLAQRSPESLADDVVGCGQRGFRHLKVARDPDRGRMRRLLDRAQDGLPDGCRIVVDAGFGWQSAAEALADVDAWGDTPLAWLEDPMAPEDTAEYAALRRACRHPIGAGDDVTDPRVYDALATRGAIDVVRLDVVSIGGVTAARRVQEAARGRGLPVSFHVYPEVSVHLAAQDASSMVETFDPDVPGGNPLDPAHTLVVGGPELRDGWACASAAAGLGFDLDWQTMSARS